MDCLRNNDDVTVRDAARQALGQAQAAPHERTGPQALSLCSVGCWQPQVQVEPGQAVQRHKACFVSFMMIFLWVFRRRDVFDAWTFGSTASSGQALETGCFPGCWNGGECRPNGFGATTVNSIRHSFDADIA
jgi:hypothetical protein